MLVWGKKIKESLSGEAMRCTVGLVINTCLVFSLKNKMF